jgi:alkaline phosphatase/alkaline phosphatase D
MRIGFDPNSAWLGPTATFRTLPGKWIACRVRFVVVTGMNYAKFHGRDRIDRARHLLENNTENRQAVSLNKHASKSRFRNALKVRPPFFSGAESRVLPGC